MKHLSPLLTVLVASCSFVPHYVRPVAPVAPSWPVGDAYLQQSEAALPRIAWQDVFQDHRLQTIIGQAFVNNRNLRIAAANITAARANYRIQRANLLPVVSIGGGVTRSSSGIGSIRTGTIGTGGTGTGGTGTGGTGTGGTGTGGAGTGGTGSGGTGTGGTGSVGGVGTGTSGSGSTRINATRFSTDIGITSFELDVFGRVAALTEAEQNRYFATEAAARTIRIALIGDIADAWANYGADVQLLRIAQDTVASANRSVAITRARLEGGIAPRSDVSQAQQVLEIAEADVAEQRTALAQDVNALQLLVGAPVEPALLPTTLDDASATYVAPRPGISSEVLLRRPDVLQAEFELRAANAEIGAARAALFPRISLTGVLGLASNALGSLFSGGAFNYSLGPSVDYSIFRGGAGRQAVVLTQAQRDAALATYERSIQTGFREVADALARYGTIDAQVLANERRVAAAQDNFNLADLRYRGGIDTFLASLDAQRSLYDARRTRIVTRLTAVVNRTALFRALAVD